jgi:hypothetical protein
MIPLQACRERARFPARRMVRRLVVDLRPVMLV